MATIKGKTLEELQSEISLLEAQLQLARTKANSKKGISFKLKRTGPQLTAAAPEFTPSGGTPSYVVPRPTEEDRASVGDYAYHVSPTKLRTLSPPPSRTMETVPVPAATASPSTNSEWFKFMREEREASDRWLERLFERMNVRDKPRDDINKAIPQVQPMKDGADLFSCLSLLR